MPACGQRVYQAIRTGKSNKTRAAEDTCIYESGEWPDSGSCCMFEMINSLQLVPVSNNIFQPAVISLLLALMLGGPFLTVLLILFGAPLTTHFPHTFLCATHMSLLAVLPLVYVHGVDATKWREVSSAYLPFDDVFGGTIGTLLGAWFGAVPIPLDWYVIFTPR